MAQAVRDGHLESIDDAYLARAWAGIDAANRVFAAAGERTLTEEEFRAAAMLAHQLLASTRPGA